MYVTEKFLICRVHTLELCCNCWLKKHSLGYILVFDLVHSFGFKVCYLKISLFIPIQSFKHNCNLQSKIKNCIIRSEIHTLKGHTLLGNSNRVCSRWWRRTTYILHTRVNIFSGVLILTFRLISRGILLPALLQNGEKAFWNRILLSDFLHRDNLTRFLLVR